MRSVSSKLRLNNRTRRSARPLEKLASPGQILSDSCSIPRHRRTIAGNAAIVARKRFGVPPATCRPRSGVKNRPKLFSDGCERVRVGKGESEQLLHSIGAERRTRRKRRASHNHGRDDAPRAGAEPSINANASRPTSLVRVTLRDRGGVNPRNERRTARYPLAAIRWRDRPRYARMSGDRPHSTEAQSASR